MNLRSLLLATAIATLLGVAACKQPQDNAKVRAAIEARNQELSAAFSRGDAAAVAAMYTPDAQMFPPNAPKAGGHDAILKGWQDFVNAGFKSLELSTAEVEACGDHADEEGTYKAVGPGGMQDVGKYVVIWKQVNGQWLLHRDIWNSDSPPPPPPAVPQAPAALPPPEAPAAPPPKP